MNRSTRFDEVFYTVVLFFVSLLVNASLISSSSSAFFPQDPGEQSSGLVAGSETKTLQTGGSVQTGESKQSTSAEETDSRPEIETSSTSSDSSPSSNSAAISGFESGTATTSTAVVNGQVIQVTKNTPRTGGPVNRINNAPRAPIVAGSMGGNAANGAIQNAMYELFGDPRVGETLGLAGILSIQGPYRYGVNRIYLRLVRADGLPFANDETLNFQFRHEVSGKEPRVDGTIEIKQGDLFAETSFLVPMYPSEYGYGFLQYEISQSNGRVLRGLTSSNLYRGFTQTGQIPRTPILIRNSNKAQFSPSLQTELSVLKASGQWQSSSFLLLDSMPANWMDIAGSLTTVMVDWDDLKTVQGEQASALRLAVWAGMNLLVCQVRDDSEEDFHRWVKENLVSECPDSSKWVKFTGAAVAMRKLPVGFGCLNVTRAELDVTYNSLQSYGGGLLADSRLENAMSADFMKWTIPSVGQPPVIAFCALIGLFAIGVGPTLLWWTGAKHKRPIWLLILFPLFALIMTGSIFAYGVLHDGFDTHCRIRSVTKLDLKEGRGIAQSRQTFFSSFPRQDVDFDRYSEVFEISSEGTRRRFRGQQEAPKTILRWDGDRQRHIGMFRPREQVQWMVTQPIENFYPIEVISKPEASSNNAKDPPAEVTNANVPQSNEFKVKYLLKQPSKYLVMTDETGAAYVARDVAPGATVNLEPVEYVEAAKEIRDNVKRLAYPANYSSNQNSSLVGWWFRSYQYDYDISSTASTGMRGIFASSNMEAAIIQAAEASSTTGLGENRFYLQVDRADHIDQPCRDIAIDSDSFHFITGVW